MLAAQSNKIEIAEILLQQLADKTLQNKNGETAMEIARQQNNVSIIKLLSGKSII